MFVMLCAAGMFLFGFSASAQKLLPNAQVDTPPPLQPVPPGHVLEYEESLNSPPSGPGDEENSGEQNGKGGSQNASGADTQTTQNNRTLLYGLSTPKVWLWLFVGVIIFAGILYAYYWKRRKSN